MRDSIISAMAAVFYFEGECSQVENSDDISWTGEHDAQSIAFAERFVSYLEALNGESICDSYHRALEANKVGKTYPRKDSATADSFGHTLAMQAIGHGISWLDCNAPFSFIHCDAAYYGHDKDGGPHGEIDCRFLSNFDGSKPSSKPFGWKPTAVSA